MAREIIFSLPLNMRPGQETKVQMYYLVYAPANVGGVQVTVQLQGTTAEAAYDEARRLVQEIQEREDPGPWPRARDFLLVYQTVSIIANP